MIQVLVTLSVKNFDVFHHFEQQAANIMRQYGGEIVHAFETEHAEDGSGEEIHLLQFPNEDAFAQYREDPNLAQLAELRQQAISHSSVKISRLIKTYY